MSDTPRTDAIVERDKGKSNLKAHNRMLDHARQLERELAEARAEIERLREDAERYRWLRDNMTFHDINHYATGTGILAPVYRKWFHDSNALHANTLDAAIDAERMESK